METTALERFGAFKSWWRNDLAPGKADTLASSSELKWHGGTSIKYGDYLSVQTHFAPKNLRTLHTMRHFVESET